MPEPSGFCPKKGKMASGLEKVKMKNTGKNTGLGGGEFLFSLLGQNA